MPIRCIIFDHDGVLADINHAAAAAFFAPLLPISMRELARRWEAWTQSVRVDEQPGTPFWVRWWDQLSDDLSLSAEVRTKLQSFDYLDFFHEFSDAKPALAAVRRRGLRIGVLSNTPLFDLQEPLKRLGLSDLVDVVCSPQIIRAMKPQPEAYTRAMAAIGVSPEECLFFDDEIVNVEGARALGIRGFHVDRTRTDHALLDSVVRDLSAVPEVLDGILD